MGNRKRDTIEINGRRYDAATGLPLFEAGESVPPKTDSPATAPKLADSSAAQVKRSPHPLAQYKRRHQPSPSRTLSRKSVKRAESNRKPTIKPSKNLSSAVSRSPASDVIKLSTASIKPIRAKHAHEVQKSPAILRFNSAIKSISGYDAPRAISRKNPKVGRTFDIASPHQSAAVRGPAQSALPSQAWPTNKFSSLVAKSERDESHRYLEYTPVKKRHGLARLKSGHRQALTFGVIGLAIILLAGFTFYEQKTNIELQLADVHSGVNASLPSYQPTGFSVGNLTYQPGMVAINYHSDDNSHHFKLVQKSSGLNSQALSDQMATRGKYKTVQSGGQTIFTSDEGQASSAAWVSGGILYEIEGNTSLSQDQIVKIATGI